MTATLQDLASTGSVVLVSSGDKTTLKSVKGIPTLPGSPAATHESGAVRINGVVNSVLVGLIAIMGCLILFV